MCDGAIECWTKTYIQSQGVVSDGRITDSKLLSARIEACADGVWVDWDEQRGPPLTVQVVKERTYMAVGEQEVEEAVLLLQATRCDTVEREVVLEEAWRDGGRSRECLGNRCNGREAPESAASGGCHRGRVPANSGIVRLQSRTRCPAGGVGRGARRGDESMSMAFSPGT